MNTKPKDIFLYPFEVKQVVSTLSQTIGWGVKQLNVPDTWKITKGEGIKVMVIDTGYTDHPDLQGGMVIAQSRSFLKHETAIHDLNGHSCVAPDTLIHTSFNGIETIEQLYNSINVPEQIEIDENGEELRKKHINYLNIKTYSIDEFGKTNINKITTLFKSVVNEECIEVELQGRTKFLLTPWHKVPVMQSNKQITKKRADELNIDQDNFLFPTEDNAGKLCEQYIDISLDNYIECVNCHHRMKVKNRSYSNKAYSCWKCKKYSKNWNTGTYFQPLTEDLAYLTGLIITDGNINLSGNGVSFTSKNKELIDKAIEIYTKYNFGTYKIVADTPCYNLRFFSANFIRFLLNIGVLPYKKSYYQQLPTIISKCPKSVICAFLGGVIDGDGCISACNTRNRITSISINWIKQLVALFNSLGMSSYYNINKNIGFNKIQNKDFPYVYNVCFTKPIPEICDWIFHPIKKERVRVHLSDNTREYRKIKSINKTDYYGHFYDFTVENDHTYIANGYFVSNTHCAGIIGARNNDFGMVGVAPECNIITAKVLGEDGSGDFEAIRSALRYAIQIKPDVISMSLGSRSYDQQSHDLIKQLYSMNIPVIAAAGNDGTQKWNGRIIDTINYPAKYPEVISVLAFDKNGKPANFNSYGSDVDFSAPGVDIYSTWIKHQYVSISGTSMATPFVAGVVALLIAKHRKQEAETGLNDCKTVDQIKQHLIKYTDDKGSVGRDHTWGYGVIDVVKTINANEADPSPITYPDPIKKTWLQKIIQTLKLIFKIQK